MATGARAIPENVQLPCSMSATADTGATVTAMCLRIIPVIERQFFAGLNIAQSEHPDTAWGECGDTIRLTGMVDVAGGVAQHLTVNALIGFRGLMLQRCPRIATHF